MIKKHIELLIIMTTGLSVFVSHISHGHAYITKSRAKLCQEQKNINCGPVIYEPQSVEGADGFPEAVEARS